MLISVAIPVLNGGKLLLDAVDAVRRQVLPEGVAYELIACDSGSRDGSVQALRERGVEVFTIAAGTFSHGPTRNLLVERARGELIAFLTQDAEPAADDWLARLIEPFGSVEQVGLTFGPYLPRAGASPMVRRELEAWFRSLSPDGGIRIDRLEPAERELPAAALYGARGFFTDANGAIARAAWDQIHFRPVPYAEDQMLAQDMLRAGFAKAFVPGAAVIHSHDYGAGEWLRRSFDETRALREIYDLDELGDIRRLGRQVWGAVGADLRGTAGRRSPAALLARNVGLLPRSLAHHGARAVGTALGARADRLPGGVVRRLSLERRE